MTLNTVAHLIYALDKLPGAMTLQHPEVVTIVAQASTPSTPAHTSAIAEWSTLAPVQWEAQADPLTRLQRDDMVKSLDAELQHLARLRGYLDGRAAGVAHAVSVRRSNKHVESVRRLLGYSQVKADLTF